MKKLKNILLVEDDEATNYVNKRIIAKMGCTENLHIAYDGVEALELLTRPNPDGSFLQPELIFLDINMPRMNGWEFLDMYAILPPQQKGENVIVMLTTSLNPSDKAKADAIGEVDDFHHKPLEELMMTEIIQKYFPD